MAVNLSKNGSALMAAYKKVVDAKTDTDWALFTYEGNSNDLRLAETGGGGLEELVEELNSGKVMYAFCRVPDPNSGLPKYVLINWTGEGVKDSRKGMCANHLSAIANFLKGAHVTINARTEEDVEPETILTKVAKASGANYNFHKQQNYIDAPRGPVGSVYRKVNAVEEIQQTNKDNFWDQAQRDEELRRKEERKRAEQERQNAEKERKELDEKQAKERERRTKERAHQLELERTLQNKRDEENRDGTWHLADGRTLQDKRDEENGEQQRLGSVYRKVNAAEEIQQTNKDNFWDQAQRDEELRRKEERKRAEQERQNAEKERKELDEKQAKERERRTKERAHQIELERTLQNKRDEEEREREQQRLNEQENSKKVTGIHAAASVQKANEAKSLISQRAFNPRDIFKQKEQSFEANTPSPATSRPGKLQSTFLSQKSFEPEEVVKSQSPPPDVHYPVTNPFSSATPVLPSLPATAFSPTLQETVTSHEQPAEDGSTEEAEWSDEFDDDADEMTPVESPVQQDLYQSPDPVGTADNLYENIYQDPTEDYNNPGDGEQQQYRARALYDYQAADDTEITFDPDDIITEIEMLDEGWWRGYGPDGNYGLFPANYVELLND
ncbi:drebrin-like protein A isoform X1 [Xiphophorus hellerii]|uniref:drebrin-like protein A isoform X1 n=1 Tax=Xiphophorus hellerii TaxID=8084 RepID=UPI0013B3C571|nr:drebrin-like protein A isoform X1 [Xiphophorus hellerii]XP_032426668.1 drebrin-like protein A isoform X1 [Xiphophorus hellerii]